MFRNKKILVIGGTGTIGSSLVKKLIDKEARVIRILSRDEFKQYNMINEFKNNRNIRFLLGDVRDYDRINRAMEDIDIVFHTAALKHVPSCEYNPFEAVKTNVLGTQNVIDAAINNDVERVILTSTDKTISPTNTYGATKLLAERLISSANCYKGRHKTIFAAVRFGNVMGSRGSVIPLFKKQILENREITVTNTTMSRFMMTLSQATDLTLKACEKANGGEIFILKMPVVNLKDLAEVIIDEVCNKYSINPKEVKMIDIGLRPGEKMFEELMTIEESKYAIEFDQMFAVTPFYQNEKYYYKEGNKAKIKNYSSDDIDLITKENLRQLLLHEKLI